jgi:hypothetical protein
MRRHTRMRRFQFINGLLLPGGGADLEPGHKFYDTAALAVELAVQANERGDYFPVSSPLNANPPGERRRLPMGH